MIDNERDKFVDVQGSLNLRDLGGYRTQDGRAVAWGRVFRSDSLDYLTVEDADYIRSTLGIVAVLDLRSSSEVVMKGGLQPEVTCGMRYYHLPLFERGKLLPMIGQGQPSARRLIDVYLWVLEKGGAQIAAALATLAAVDNLPAVFFCSAGKDRSGILAAIILGLIGVDEKDITKDYVLTNRNIDRIIDRVRADFGDEEFEGLPPEFLLAQPETMRALLDSLRRKYGSINDYVRAQGISDSVVIRLKKLLLE